MSQRQFCSVYPAPSVFRVSSRPQDCSRGTAAHCAVPKVPAAAAEVCAVLGRCLGVCCGETSDAMVFDEGGGGGVACLGPDGFQSPVLVRPTDMPWRPERWSSKAARTPCEHQRVSLAKRSSRFMPRGWTTSPSRGCPPASFLSTLISIPRPFTPACPPLCPVQDVLVPHLPAAGLGQDQQAVQGALAELLSVSANCRLHGLGACCSWP